MKKLILFVSLLAMPLTMLAQNKSFSSLYNSFSGKGVVTMSVEASVFQMMGVAALDLNGMNIDQIRLIKSSDDDDAVKIRLKNAISQLVVQNGYTKLMEINNENEEIIRFYTYPKGNEINELMMVVDGDDYVVINIAGKDLDPKKMVNL